MNQQTTQIVKREKSLSYKMRSYTRNYELYIMLIPVLAYYIIFHYMPMYGVQIAFKDFLPTKGIWGSPWVGFKHFERFFSSFYFSRIIKNTIGISLYMLIAGFPAPILFALLLNEVKNIHFKKLVQNISYIPHFLSVVVVVGMLISFTSIRNGVINEVIKYFGGEPVNFMVRNEWFKTMYVFTGIWQQMGWNAILYIAALAGINPELYEAAIVDGANKLKRIIHISIPGIMPTVIILLILNIGRLLNVGFEKVLLMQNPLNLESSDVISTYVYRVGILQAEYSFSSAVGLFNSVINFGLLLSANFISRRVSEYSLW